MADTSMVANLFGVDPALLGQQQTQMDENRAYKLAQLDPMQAAMVSPMAASATMARNVGSLLGVEDPAMAKNAKLLAVKKQAQEMGLDKNSPDGMAKYAQLLSEAGLDDVAHIAKKRAMEMAEQTAKTDKAQGDLKREAMFRQAISSLDPASPTYQQDLMKVASQFGSPDKVMDVHTKSLDRQERLEAKALELKQKHEDRMEELKLRGADMKEMQRERLAFQAQMQAINAELRRDLAFMRPEPAPSLATIVDPNDPSKQIVVDARTMRKIGDSGKLTDGQKADAKSKISSGGVDASIQQARDILQGVRRDSDGNPLPAPKPTGSLAGSLYDTAASVVGASPEGAAEADALKVIAGKLTMASPRFEGPQGVLDVKLYQQMAADVGNEKLPISRRLRALEEVERLHSKAAKTGGQKPSVPAPPAGFKVDL